MTDVEWFTYAEAASKLGISVRTLKRRIHAGNIRVIRPGGGQPMVTAREIEAYRAAAERMVAA